jgi:hypothetical protein
MDLVNTLTNGYSSDLTIMDKNLQIAIDTISIPQQFIAEQSVPIIKETGLQAIFRPHTPP